jgi:hypothetical protein
MPQRFIAAVIAGKTGSVMDKADASRCLKFRDGTQIDQERADVSAHTLSQLEIERKAISDSRKHERNSSSATSSRLLDRIAIRANYPGGQ